jgi:hypothetical protein
MQIAIPVPVVTGPIHDEVDPEAAVEDQLDIIPVLLVAMAMGRRVRRRPVASRVDGRPPFRMTVVDAPPERGD